MLEGSCPTRALTVALGAAVRVRTLTRGLPRTLGTLALAGLLLPGAAAAHGPVAPVATSYLARISLVPDRLRAQVVDGYVRMWMQAPADETATVLDYAGAPYLRFDAAGVQVNRNSAMYYLNQSPAQAPPASLRRMAPPSWQPVSSGHSYEWHDGRLQALAAIALTPGQSYLGPWSIPLRIDGRRAALRGGLWHADDPPLVWFWPVLVIVVCVLAGWRLERPALHALLARGLATVALLATAVAVVGQDLHGRPEVSVTQYVELVVILSLVALALLSVTRGRFGYFGYCVIAFVSLWQGITLIPTLLHPFVLIALPAPVARTATVLCLGAGGALLPLVFRLAEQPQADRKQLA